MNKIVKQTIKVIKQDCYNLNRPSNIIISELVEVIKYLLNRRKND